MRPGVFSGSKRKDGPEMLTAAITVPMWLYTGDSNRS